MKNVLPVTEEPRIPLLETEQMNVRLSSLCRYIREVQSTVVHIQVETVNKCRRSGNKRKCTGITFPTAGQL